MAENQLQDSLQATKEADNKIKKHKTTDYTLLPKTEDLWAQFSNKGASAKIIIQLPTAVVGDGFRFKVAESQNLTITPYGAETIENPVTGLQGNPGQRIYSETANSYVDLECTTTGEWEITLLIGTWGTSSGAILIWRLLTGFN